MISVIRHGHSFVEISFGKGSILIDPYISGNSSCDIDIDNILKKDIIKIVLTHGHSDHIGDTVAISKKLGCEVVACFELANYLEKVCGLGNIYPMNVGGEYHFDHGTIKYVNAVHGCGVADLGNGWSCPSAGVIFRCEGKNIYHAGDTALTYDMKLLGDYDRIDVCLLPIGGTYTMGISDAVIAAGFIKPKIVVPIHYNTFESIKVDPVEFARLIMSENNGIVPKVLDPGQYVLLD